MGLIVRNINMSGNFRGVFPQVPPPPPPPPAPSDVYGAYTVLDLPGTGTNNTNNNVFVDSSANNFSITRFGNTTQGSFSPFSTQPGYWSNYFDGSGDTVTAPPGSAFAYGTGNFTVEAWIYPTAMNPSNALIFSQSVSGTNYFILVLRANGTIEFTGTSSGGGSPILGSSVVNLNTWSHIAVVRNSGVVTVFVNGVGGTGASNTTDFTNTTYVPTIGAYTHTGTNNYTGYISNLRIVKGTAVYTSNFTPSTTPLTAVSGTSLLTCQSNRFVDSSSNAFAISRNGNTAVSAFGPFAPNSSYNAATMGGSMYFDGSGDGLSRSINSTTDGMYPQGTTYTIECWIYLPDATVGYIYNTAAFNDNYFGCYLIYTNGSSISLNYRSNTGLQFPSTELTFTPSTPFVGSWTHIVISVLNGAVKCFVNGVQAGSTQSIPAMAFTPVAAGFGPWANGYNTPSGNFYGYISNFRIVQGSAVYTTNFTPPTAPVTAISGTSLLLNGTNGAIYDASTKNVLETLGDAKVSTTVSATGSMYFDGNGDYLLVLSNPMFGFGVGDFTIEAWVYPTANPTNGIGTIADFRTGATASATCLRINNSRQLMFYNGPANIDTTFTSQTVALNAWSHIAYVRSSNTVYGYVNGQLAGSVAVSSNLGSNQPVLIGINNAPGYAFNGYINNLRVTKGIARYTGNFTPPTRS